MGIVEAGQQKASVQIDDSRVGPGKFSNRGVIADREDPGTIQCDGLSARLRRVFRPYLPIDEDQARFRRQRAAAASAEHNDERG